MHIRIFKMVYIIRIQIIEVIPTDLVFFPVGKSSMIIFFVRSSVLLLVLWILSNLYCCTKARTFEPPPS